MDSLINLENNVQALLEHYQMLRQQLFDLQQENERQRQEIMRTHAELVQAKADYKHLETAYALLSENTDDEQRERVRTRLTNMIAQIDRAIEALRS